MAVKSLRQLYRPLISAVVALSVISGALFYKTAVVWAIPYGVCGYSTQTFNDAGSRCSNGSLVGTGQNWVFFLIAAVGLLVGISALIAFIVIVRRRTPPTAAAE